MGLLHKGVSILQFDETYDEQEKLQSFPHEDINLRSLHHTNLFCEETSLRHIRSVLQNRRQRGMTFLGSGNYHYVTSLLLEEAKTPFSLVLFDNHPDMDKNFDHKMLSCGSWVSYALKENSLLEKVIIIGPTSLKEPLSHPKVTIFPFSFRHHYDFKMILSAVHTDSIYISIDKDVLDPVFAETNWDQGIMEKDMLISYLQKLIAAKYVFGIDVCGENPSSPAEQFLPSNRETNWKNDIMNTDILTACLHAAPRHVAGA